MNANSNPTLDLLVKKHSAFLSFDDLLDAGGRYRPSLYVRGKSATDAREIRAIADAYDFAQQARGDTRRAYRGDF